MGVMNNQNGNPITVFITGADRGLGLSLTRAYLKVGCNVFAGSFMPKWHELKTLEKESLADNRGNLVIIPLDVSCGDSVNAAFQQVSATVDSLDILYNNAAIYLTRCGSIFETLYWDDILAQYKVNAMGPLRVTQAFLPLLLKGTMKRLVNISSEIASMGNCRRSKEFGYAMAKTGVNRQSVLLQRELKPHGIKVYAIHPGYVRSYMLGRLNEDATDEPDDVATDLFNLIAQKPDLDSPVYTDRFGEVIPF